MEQTQRSKEKYRKLVSEVSPPSNIAVDCLKAFCVGGLICTIGQFINKTLMDMNVTKDNAGLYTSVVLIFVSVVLTGLGLYAKIGKFGGAGSVVPITGFANSVASPAIEYKKEGFILGVGAKMFLIAGPVILYGTVTSIIAGAIYYLLK